jgi:hypothetical protein
MKNSALKNGSGKIGLAAWGRPALLFALALFVSSVGAGLAFAKDDGGATGIVGQWLDSQMSDVKMSVKKDDGVFRVTAGNDAYGYELACLFKDNKGVCTGWGGKLEGENFLYHSLIELQKDGSLREEWRAFNNLSDSKGTTIWKRR